MHSAMAAMWLAASLFPGCACAFAGESAALPPSLAKKRFPQLPGGTGARRLDLDRNGYRDLIVVTFNPRSDGQDVKLTTILIDRERRPVPWQAWGYFEVDNQGVSELLDIDNDGRAELVYLHVEGDQFDGERSSLSLYAARDAHWERVSGPVGGMTFPLLEPPGTNLLEQPDLTNAVAPSGGQVRITSLIPGRAEDCGVQLPITRDPDGTVSVDTEAAAARRQSCYDKLALSDGRKLNVPEIVVLDRPGGRQVSLMGSGKHTSLLNEAKADRLSVQVVGRSCASGCRPFLLWAYER